MAIAFGTIGAKSAGGTTTINVPHPASPAANDMFVAGRCIWLSTGTATAESGWTAAGDLTGGTGSANDVHTTRIRGDYKIAAGGETGNVTFDQAGTLSGAVGVMARYTKAAGKNWFVKNTYANLGAVEAAFSSYTMGHIETQINGGMWWFADHDSTGTDNSSGANRSAACTAIHLKAGDMLVALVAVDTDASMTITSPTFTASGITFGTVNRRTSGAGVLTGVQGNIELFDCLVSSGTANAAITFAMTTATVQAGPVCIVRLREVDPIVGPTPVYAPPQSHPGKRVLGSILSGGGPGAI